VIRAVVDTNVLISGMISPAGNEALILLAIGQALVKPYFSAEILLEYAEVLARPKFEFPLDEIEALIELVNDRGEEVQVPSISSSTLPDPADEKFLTCAKAAGVDFIITGNKRDFPSKACEPIQVVNAAELLDRITQEI
jgi:uncharacterized protein